MNRDKVEFTAEDKLQTLVILAHQRELDAYQQLVFELVETQQSPEFLQEVFELVGKNLVQFDQDE